ncbi:MAG: sigma-70 family RNA polymerase sigma factor [Planctomycetota bacterium]|jgi:RNA polymerase sigma-70 factor (ECF subfamily)
MRLDGGAARIEELLQDDGWLRGLVLGLVREDEVDDVVQETRLAALNNPPRRMARSWLGRVAQNFARRRQRDEGRRRRHEALAAGTEALPSTEETVQRMAASRRVTKAVSGLREPFRSAVILRWYHGLEYSQIANQLEISEANARQRCSRGLALLRLELETEFGSDWRQSPALMLLTLPTARGLPLSASKTSIPLITGALIVKKFAPTAAVAVLLIAGGTAIYMSGDSEASPITTPALSPESSPIASSIEIDRADEATQRERLVAEASGDSEDELFHIQGRVIDLRGQPVAGVTLTDQPPLRDVTPASSKLEFPEPAKDLGQSDDTGLFDITLASLPMDCFGVAEPWMLTYSQPPKRNEREQTGIMVVVAPSLEVSGRIYDQDGQPLGGVMVAGDWDIPSGLSMPLDKLRSFRRFAGTQSDDEGVFLVDRVPGGGCSLVFRKPGYHRVRVEVPVEGLDEQVIRMRKGGEEEIILRGTVVDAQNRLVEGARVGLDMTETRTDRYGSFELVLPESSLVPTYSLVAGKAGHQSLIIEKFGSQAKRHAERDEALELRLPGPSLSITGRLIDAEGNPLARMPIFPWQEPRAFREMTAEDLGVDENRAPYDVAGNPIYAHSVSSSEGVFNIEGLRRKDYRLRLYDPKKLFVFTTDPIPAGSEDVEIRLPADVLREKITGTLRTSDGNPVAGASVSYWMEGISNEVSIVRQGGMVGKTDADGRFELKDIPRYGGTLGFSAESISTLEHELAPEAPGTDLELTALRMGHFQVEVVTNADKATGCYVLDAEGNQLQITKRTLGAVSVSSWLQLKDGKSAVVAVSELATTLVIHGGPDGELARLPMRCVPGEVLQLRY